MVRHVDIPEEDWDPGAYSVSYVSVNEGEKDLAFLRGVLYTLDIVNSELADKNIDAEFVNLLPEDVHHYQPKNILFKLINPQKNVDSKTVTSKTYEFIAGRLIAWQFRRELETLKFKGEIEDFHEAKTWIESDFTVRGSSKQIEAVKEWFEAVERDLNQKKKKNK